MNAPAIPYTALAPVLGLPTYSSTAEELRLLSLLAAAPRGLSFLELAPEGTDPIVAYGALFRLLTRGVIIPAELPSAAIGYRLRRRQRRTATARAQGNLSLA